MPHAGGAGIAWELLITVVVRRVLINDNSPHLFSFWTIVLNHTNDLCQRIREARLSVDKWDHQKEIFSRPDGVSTIELGFSCFYLNRANRSGILKAGLIGGRNQIGKWRMDARFNRENLIHRIMKIAECAGCIEVSCADAVDFLREKSGNNEAHHNHRHHDTELSPDDAHNQEKGDQKHGCKEVANRVMAHSH